MTEVLRAGLAEDAPALADVHRRAIAAVPDDILSPEQRESWAAGISPDVYLRACAAGEAFALAEIDGAVAGFCSYRTGSPDAEIVGLYVDPAFQNRGIARRLTELVEARLFDSGATRIELKAGPAGQAVWGALGYQVIGRGTHDSRGGLALPVAVMEKAVTDAARRPARNFYGRRKGQHLKSSQARYLTEDLAALSPGPVDWETNPERRPLDLGALFGGREVWLEVGFGGGEHMVHQAAANPDVGIIGCEPYINGVAMLLGKIRAAGVENLKVHPGDARDLFDVLEDGAVSKAFLLYPDPWPKTRHHRRRFVTAEHLAPLARVLKRGAEFRVATDIPDYVRQTLLEVPKAGFDWLAEGPRDWRTPWEDWIATRYEQKALRAGRVPHYLSFRKN
ncbi:MAG: tRNA (guanosine(46)-N7)-methyltransferase TrmB [Roseicyclus sp.]|nr:tRNA (guanosine(46)-N7)-methyltransferase TrmB [Roseicyclus sp.]MBO6624617.1 tRNA (guanosine(46)-N7)-methyltransferase TrmB [Roseicyclus sp.]MBO6921609.1 tRNA (guanosine(46)-N7)-methyltransferase TrmB [Roseicyclus sp.]